MDIRRLIATCAAVLFTASPVFAHPTWMPSRSVTTSEPRSREFPVNHIPLDERFEQLDRFWKRCLARPSFKAAYADRNSGVEEIDKAAQVVSSERR